MHAVGREMIHGKNKAVCDTKLLNPAVSILTDSQPQSGPVLTRSLNILKYLRKRGKARHGRISMEVR